MSGNMLKNYDYAVSIFEKLPPHTKTPSYHPYYIKMDALRDKNLIPVFFIVEQHGDVFYHGLHVKKLEGERFSLLSPYGYGGPLASTDDPQFLHYAWQAWRTWQQANTYQEEIFRFHPLLQNWNKYHGQPRDVRQTVWIDLTSDDLMSSYRSGRRSDIRKAMKASLRVEWLTAENFVEPFKAIYESRMQILGAKDFYFFPDEYYQSLASWQNSKLAVCKQQDEIVAASIFLIQPGHLMEYHLSGATPEGQRLSAVSLILHEAAMLGKRLGCCKLHLGGGTTNDLDDPLFFFKSGFSKLRGQYKIAMPL